METIRLNVSIKTDPQTLYAALTTEEGLANWWAKQTTAKAEVGFVNTFTFGSFVNKMQVTQLDAPKKVAWRCIDSLAEWVGTTISFDLEQRDQKVLLRFTQAGWPEATDLFAGCTYDWARFLSSLKAYCETGSGMPA